LKAFWILLWANKPRYGGYIVHIAILLITIGIVGSSFYNVEKEAALRPGESMTIKNYTLTYESTDRYETQSKLVVSSTLSVYNEGKLIGKLIPEKYFHRSHEQPVKSLSGPSGRSNQYQDRPGKEGNRDEAEKESWHCPWHCLLPSYTFRLTGHG